MRILGFREYGGPEVLSELDVPDPSPGEGQVVIDLRASGINPADIKVRNGSNPGFPVEFPMAVGREASGVVTAVGSGVSDVAVGDHVFGAAAAGTGTVAESVLLNAASTAAKPEGLSWAEAASIPVSVGTAYDAIDEFALPPGSTLLIIGAGGGVGSSAVQIAAARGIRVIGAASAAKSDAIVSFGGIPVVSGDGWVSRVRDSADGPVDAILDTVGFDVLREATSALAGGGRIISTASVDVAGEYGGGGVERRRTTKVFEACAALASGPELTVEISATYPFERAVEAVAAVETGHARGNVVVTRS
ncbi:zinc-binding dehydrogenase [Epidermidibacterium keratini]|uniref:Zinc-binding dehydrogenase n=1 Tax=Epidermidibacterium keratini TaxID=1891644 RepID=A0A7L4YMB2_9ACTN|nr:NADP-dependent oxidoreductase [Epidermidibacterium keratini]QHC00013.1 zinc-binding dehydrogenase [Epidermidibacterium keratini]